VGGFGRADHRMERTQPLHPRPAGDDPRRRPAGDAEGPAGADRRWRGCDGTAGNRVRRSLRRRVVDEHGSPEGLHDVHVAPLAVDDGRSRRGVPGTDRDDDRAAGEVQEPARVSGHVSAENRLVCRSEQAPEYARSEQGAVAGSPCQNVPSECGGRRDRGRPPAASTSPADEEAPPDGRRARRGQRCVALTHPAGLRSHRAETWGQRQPRGRRRRTDQ
jgi:hypothetical protein